MPRPNFVIGRNRRDTEGNSIGVPECMCADEFKRTYWRPLEIIHCLDYPDAVGFDSHESAWKAADMYGGHPVQTATYGQRLRNPLRRRKPTEESPGRPRLALVIA